MLEDSILLALVLTNVLSLGAIALTVYDCFRGKGKKRNG